MLGQCIFAIPLCGITYQTIHKVHLHIYLSSTFFVGIPSVLGLYLFTYAFRLTSNPGKTSIFFLGNVFTAYLFSLFRYSEPINWVSMIGSIILVIGLAKVVLTSN